MTKAEWISKYGLASYEKTLKANRERTKSKKYYGKTYKEMAATLPPEKMAKIREYNRLKQQEIRQSDRTSYNEYHKEYYKKNKAKIRERVNAQRRTKALKKKLGENDKT